MGSSYIKRIRMLERKTYYQILKLRISTLATDPKRVHYTLSVHQRYD